MGIGGGRREECEVGGCERHGFEVVCHGIGHKAVGGGGEVDGGFGNGAGAEMLDIYGEGCGLWLGYGHQWRECGGAEIDARISRDIARGSEVYPHGCFPCPGFCGGRCRKAENRQVGHRGYVAPHGGVAVLHHAPGGEFFAAGYDARQGIVGCHLGLGCEVLGGGFQDGDFTGHGRHCGRCELHGAWVGFKLYASDSCHERGVLGDGGLQEHAVSGHCCGHVGLHSRHPRGQLRCVARDTRQECARQEVGEYGVELGCGLFFRQTLPFF